MLNRLVVVQSRELHDAVAQVVVPMLMADGELGADEHAVARRLDHAGLGPLSQRVARLLERLAREPIDLHAACGTIRAGGRTIVGAVLSMLARVAGADGGTSAPGVDRFLAIASQLGVDMDEALRYVRPVRHDPLAMTSAARRTTPEAVLAALRQLGLSCDATRSEVEAAYLQLVERHDPARLAPFGADFVSLAVRELSAITESYERARAAARA